MKIFAYVMVAIGATGVLFGTARFFARGQPATMTKEYQEATNDYLKVCAYGGYNRCLCAASAYMRNTMLKDATLTHILPTGHERRAHHRYLIRGLRRPRPGPEPARKEVDALHREKSRERKKCSRISGRSKARAYSPNIERRSSVCVRESCFLALAVVKTLEGSGESLVSYAC